MRLKNLVEPLATKVESHIVVARRDRHGTKLYDEDVPDEEIIEGIYVHRVSYPFKLPSKILQISRQRHVSVIQVHNLEMIVYALPALLLLRRCQLIIDIHTLKPLPSLLSLPVRLALKYARYVIVLSRFAHQYIARAFSLPESKVVVIYNGVDLSRFSPGPKDPSLIHRLGLGDHLIIGYLGSMYTFQGVHEFLHCACRVIEEVSNVKFLMVGSGPELQAIQKEISEKGLEQHIILTGPVPAEQAASYLNLMDIFVIARPKTLETETAIPLKLIEAMALGKPIVATSVSSFLEILKNGVNALVVEPKIDAIVDGVLQLINNPYLRNRFGKNARQVALGMSWARSVEKLLAVYQSVDASLP